MNQSKKIIPILAIFSAIFLSSCSSGLDPKAMELTLNTKEGWGDYTYTVLTIRSLKSEPITLTKATVNNGRCSYSGPFSAPLKLPRYFEIGQTLNLYLKCSADDVVKVDLETNQGDLTYSFK